MRQRERLAEAKRRGARAGLAAASWVFDGNTSDTVRAAIAQMLADGDPALSNCVSEPAWLSGEWAGESVQELLGDLLHEGKGPGESWGDVAEQSGKNDDISDAYTNAASAAFWREVERGARLRLDGAA